METETTRRQFETRRVGAVADDERLVVGHERVAAVERAAAELDDAVHVIRQNQLIDRHRATVQDDRATARLPGALVTVRLPPEIVIRLSEEPALTPTTMFGASTAPLFATVNELLHPA